MMNKDTEWLKKEIGTEMIELEPNRKERWSDVRYQTLRDVAQKIDQINEPEVLSQKWIDEHATAVTYDEILDRTETTYVVDLENLIVPKQELPVIPKYVGEWITNYRDKYDLYPALKTLENNTLVWGQIYEWYRLNTQKFVNAYLTGEYEVEEEPLYHALIKGHDVSNSDDIYWNYDKYDNDVFVSRLYPSHDNFLTEMSKAEWIKLGINDSNADFVEVRDQP